jgi:hypothetical protein
MNAHQISNRLLKQFKGITISTNTSTVKSIWLCADHFSVQYRTKPNDPTDYTLPSCIVGRADVADPVR